jgi:hypothetical protein
MHRGKRWHNRPIADVDPVIRSEACRAADLLVSATGFALEEDDLGGAVSAGALGVHLVGQPTPPSSGPEHPRVSRERRLQHIGELPLGEMARMRRNVLAHAFAEPIAAGALVLEARHLRIGPHSIHLATARITRDGAPVKLELAGHPNLKAMPWLPYDENLLERIADSACILLAGGDVPSHR